MSKVYLRKNPTLAALIVLLCYFAVAAGAPGPRAVRHDQDPYQGDNTLEEADRLDAEIAKLYGQKNYDQAIPLAKRALKLKETLLPKDHSRIAFAASVLAQLYMLNGKYPQAEPLLLRAIQLNETARKQTDALVISDLERYACLLTYFQKHDALKRFEERRVEILKLSDEPDRFWGVLQRVTEVITMPKPDYPAKARREGAHGFVQIKVSLDEQGQVTKAASMCGGDRSLIAASEDAARRSRFKPILIGGKPLRVIGYLSYRFINR